MARAIACALLAGYAMGANPVVPNVGMADPHVHFFNGRFYMYATHDFSPNNTGAPPNISHKLV